MSQGSSKHEFLGPLRTTALIAAFTGAGASVGFLFRAGQGNKSRLLLVVMTTWVLAPFVALVCASALSKRWPVLPQATLYSVMLVVTLGSLAIYGIDAVKPLNQKAAFVFVVVPLASWLVVSLAVPAAAFISARRLRRGERA